MISLASVQEGELIKAYSFPQRDNMVVTIEHRYLTNCQLVKSIQVYYIILTTVYLLLSFGWVVLVWTIYDD